MTSGRQRGDNGPPGTTMLLVLGYEWPVLAGFGPRNPSRWPWPDRQFRFPAGSGQIDPSRTRSSHFWPFPGSTDHPFGLQIRGPGHLATARRSRRFARDRGGTFGWLAGWPLLRGTAPKIRSPLPRGNAPKIRSPLPRGAALEIRSPLPRGTAPNIRSPLLKGTAPKIRSPLLEGTAPISGGPNRKYHRPVVFFTW